MEFFTNEEIVEFEIGKKIFKYKPVTANDELNWVDDYYEDAVKINAEGKEIAYRKQNTAKLAKCKLRNIVEIPFTQEETKAIAGIDKDFSQYTNAEKDLLFGKLTPNVFNQLIKNIDKINGGKKKQ